MNNGLTNTYVYALAINASGDIFAGTWGGGIFRSTDNGESWTEVNTGITVPYILSFAINASGDLFAGADFGGGVYRSTNMEIVGRRSIMAYDLEHINALHSLQMAIFSPAFTAMVFPFYR